MKPLTISRKEKHIELIFKGNLTKEHFKALGETIEEGKELIRKTSVETGRHVDILLDMGGYAGTYDTEAMEMLALFARANREFVRKTACFGGSAAAVLAGEVVSDLAERGNISFFATRQEAEAWLKQ